MNLEVPYEGVGSIHSLVKLIDPCVRKQGLYAHPLFPDVIFWTISAFYRIPGEGTLNLVLHPPTRGRPKFPCIWRFSGTLVVVGRPQKNDRRKVGPLDPLEPCYPGGP